jgi:CHASE2 domain-containing sensor protein
MLRTQSLLSRRFWQRAISVLIVVLAFNVVVQFDGFRKTFPFVQSAQLQFHRFLCSLIPRPISPKWVRVVEIDTDLHLTLKEPTNRTFLASLVSNAAAGRAAAIVLDFKFVVPKGNSPGEDAPELQAQNKDLWEAIGGALKTGVPVVLPCWLKIHPKLAERIPNVFPEQNLAHPDMTGDCTGTPCDGVVPEAACARMGNINLPADLRQIPLVTPTQPLVILKQPTAARTQQPDPCSQSLALAAASAFEDTMHLCPRTRNKNAIRAAIERNEFVFGSFIPETDFQTISATGLAGWAGSDEKNKAVELCRGRIVIIGGKWKADFGNGEPVDSYDTPAGKMAGMFLHANYIEALLDDRYQREVSLGFGTVFDLVVGFILYFSFHNARTMRGKLFVLGVFFLPLLFSYVLFANLNYYLDFILVLVGCFVHLVVEFVLHYINLRSSLAGSSGNNAEGRPA